VRLVAGQRTDVGRVREGNEDGYFVDDDMGLFAVADGMGGHRAGEVASATALEALVAAVKSGRPIADAIALANDAVLERSAGDERLRGMGTTMTAGTLAAGDRLLVGHVGDSRAYLVRDGELRQITEDHSLVEEMVRGGELTPEQAEDHPQRSIITRALGIEPEVEVDVYPVELRAGDRLLLCSDGLTTMVRTDDITAILRGEPDPQRAANLLVDAANEAGGEDNVTVVVLDVDGDTAPPPGEQEEEATREDGEEGRESEAAAEPGEVRPDRRRRANTVGRVLRWALPVVLILGVAVFTVWYARRSEDERPAGTTTTSSTTTTSTTTTTTTTTAPPLVSP
jgi:PPM family protein phosphatase